ncbi:hypothetical protein F5J12DRAFT_783990 [Pisolithus orientalis]|uniref:uncharacterized protein n=1 Tax=Pisolithus orientalis TaxID=936130 RepID=UPI002224BFCA|nr:uncharacterized protein F5J12DRAFT_783990 [Pisolithus orientalis]KAI6002242.1 hypothetical protein F5J12DRAFT_783990 [Pisolithus orientalis]
MVRYYTAASRLSGIRPRGDLWLRLKTACKVLNSGTASTRSFTGTATSQVEATSDLIVIVMFEMFPFWKKAGLPCAGARVTVAIDPTSGPVGGSGTSSRPSPKFTPSCPQLAPGRDGGVRQKNPVVSCMDAGIPSVNVLRARHPEKELPDTPRSSGFGPDIVVLSFHGHNGQLVALWPSDTALGVAELRHQVMYSQKNLWHPGDPTVPISGRDTVQAGNTAFKLTSKSRHFQLLWPDQAVVGSAHLTIREVQKLNGSQREAGMAAWPIENCRGAMPV